MFAFVFFLLLCFALFNLVYTFPHYGRIIRFIRFGKQDGGLTDFSSAVLKICNILADKFVFFSNSKVVFT